MAQTDEPVSRVSTWLAALLPVLFVLQAGLSVLNQDDTYDEHEYFGVGRSILTTGRWTVPAAFLHPPLSFYVNSVPLLFVKDLPATPQGGELFASRLASLLVFGLPLLLAIYAWSKELYGRTAALVALTLAAFSPNLLAHAGLITVDFPLTSMGFIAVYLCWRCRCCQGANWRRFAAWSSVLGLALLTKASAWLYVLSLSLLWFLPAGGRPWSRRKGLASLLGGIAVAWLVLCAGYGFTGMVGAGGKSALLGKVPDRFPESILSRLVLPFFPLSYLRMVGRQLEVARGVWTSYLMGRLSKSGWWYYFLIAFAIKATLSFQLLLAASVVFIKRVRSSWTNELWLLLPPVVFFAVFSFVGHVDIGLRYVLPAFPFLMVFASKVVRLRDRARRLTTLAVGTLLAWHILASVLVFPDHLAYFNELIGGPRQGYRYLADSNLDWGQNLTRVREYARQHDVLVEPDTLPASGRVAVSVNDLVGIFDARRYRRLRESYEPVDRVGYNWLIYDLDRNRGTEVKPGP